MDFLTGVISALIAAGVSIGVACISYVSNRNELQVEKEKLARQQQREMTIKLYDKRLEVYPEAIHITAGLRRSKLAVLGEETCPEYFTNILTQLDEWHGTKAFLLLSEDAVQSLYALRRILRKKPEAEGKYSIEQLEAIQNAKNRFRYALRLDIQLLYREESSPFAED